MRTFGRRDGRREETGDNDSDIYSSLNAQPPAFLLAEGPLIYPSPLPLILTLQSTFSRYLIYSSYAPSLSAVFLSSHLKRKFCKGRKDAHFIFPFTLNAWKILGV